MRRTLLWPRYRHMIRLHRARRATCTMPCALDRSHHRCSRRHAILANTPDPRQSRRHARGVGERVAEVGTTIGDAGLLHQGRALGDSHGKESWAPPLPPGLL